jgi:Ca2+-transporting ATPase
VIYKLINVISHSSEIKEVYSSLEVTDQGLSEVEAKLRLEKFGPNELELTKINYFSILINQVKSPVIYILVIAAFLSFFLGDSQDFFIIMGIILINTLIGFTQELKAEFSTAELKKLTETKVIVLRENVKKEVHSSSLVPGDIVILSVGDMVSADIRLIDSNSLLVDESTLTGESFPVEKDAGALLETTALPYELENMVLSGTLIVKGDGLGIVVKTGESTYFGSIAKKTMEASPQSPLNMALNSFLKKYLIFIVITLAIVGSVYYYKERALKDTIYILLALLVSAIPEGLPIVITLVLAYGARILHQKKVLVRQLAAVETLGNTTVIASDKTGTITEGKLTVKKIYTDDEEKLRLVSALCNESIDEKGDPVDVALAKWLGGDYELLREKHKQIELFPFDSEARMMATRNRVGKKEMVFIKGAFDSIVHKAKNKIIHNFAREHNLMAEKGLRVIALGIGEGKDPFNSGFTLVGLIGFIDPPKPGVKEAIATAAKAGIRVIMITGDNPLTAKAVAEEIGIYKEGDRILTGREIETMTDEALLLALEETTVLARILPEFKYKIVKLLRQKKEIIAVTGDGVNDVPAIKAADLGIAMGNGTEAAKSSAKMILIDNNLQVIIDAVKEGRIIAENIKKVVYYLLSSSLSQISLIFISVILSLPLPLYPIHILWINLVADGVQDKTFPFIKEEGNVMANKPKKIDQLFLDNSQIFRIIASTFVITAANLVFFIYMINNYHLDIATTAVFTSMVFSQWVNGIHAQKEKEPFFKNLKSSFTINPYIWVGITLGIILQGIAVYFMHTWLETVSLSLEHFYPILITTAAVFFGIEIVKWITIFIESRPIGKKKDQ